MNPEERFKALEWFSHLNQSTREKLANSFFYFKDESIATGREVHQLYLELNIQNNCNCSPD